MYRTLDEVMERIGGANPVTGPIAVEGVEPGDYVAVRLGAIEGAPVTGFGYMTTTPTLHPDLEAETVICRRVGAEVAIPTGRGPIRVPYRPFVGTLGVAPADGPIASFAQRRDVMGNVDLPEVTSGATVVLRANVAGALVSLGDAHLAQGDAEIHRSAVEAQADVEVTLTRLDPDAVVYGELPQVNTATELGSVAPGPGHLENLVRSAYDDLTVRLERGYGFSLAEAYRLLGAVGTIRVGQVVPPVYSVVAKIERRYVEGGS